MKTIILELSEEQFARLRHSAERRHETLPELLKARLVGLLEDPTDPFDPRWHRSHEMEEDFARRIA
jgi:hypothetical protein